MPTDSELIAAIRADIELPLRTAIGAKLIYARTHLGVDVGKVVTRAHYKENPVDYANLLRKEDGTVGGAAVEYGVATEDFGEALRDGGTGDELVESIGYVIPVLDEYSEKVDTNGLTSFDRHVAKIRALKVFFRSDRTLGLEDLGVVSHNGIQQPDPPELVPAGKIKVHISLLTIEFQVEVSCP